MTKQKRKAKNSASAPGRRSASAAHTESTFLSFATSAASKTHSALSYLYSKIPVLPFLDRSTSAILIICLLAYGTFILGVFFTTPPFELGGRIEEGALVKNAQLSLLPGERYVYVIKGDGGTQEVSYQTSIARECRGLLLTEYPTQLSACLSKSGNLAEPGMPPANSSLGNQSMLIFSPWMLAASDSFLWEVRTIVEVQDTEIILPTTFQSKGSEKVGGRDAFYIVASADSLGTIDYYIDKEHRILLLAKIGNASARLISAPFALDWQYSTSQN